MKIKALLTATIILICTQNIIAQQDAVKWLTFAEAEKLDSAEHRPFLIDVYTDWCGWCKRMSAVTFNNQGIANYINRNFYPIRFDAETTDTVYFRNKEYKNDGKVNALAVKLLEGRLSYPTIVYIDRDTNTMPIPGYMEPKDIEPLLVYFAENVSRNSDPDSFRKDFMFTYPNVYADDIKKSKEPDMPDTTGKIEWLTFEEAFAKSEKEPKPLLINLWIDFFPEGVKYSISGNIINTVFKNPSISDYINKNFYPVKFYAASQDTVNAFGQTFVGSGKGMPHQLTGALMNNNYTFPSMFFFTKEKQYITRMNDYFNSKTYKIILQFYAEEAYKKENFIDFYRRNNKNGR